MRGIVAAQGCSVSDDRSRRPTSLRLFRNPSFVILGYTQEMEKALTMAQRIALTYLPRTAPARWVSSTKQAIVEAVRCDLLTLEDLWEKYEITPEECNSWAELLAEHGAKGLRVTRTQAYRSTKEVA